MPPKVPKESFIDALRLSERERSELIARLDAKNALFSGDNRRTSSRFRYHLTDGLIVEITHPGGTITKYLVRPRDLSTRGLSFLHGAFLYPNSPCRLILQTVNGEPATLVGRVMRCQHVSGRAHDIGIQFVKPIRLEDYMAMDTSTAAATSTELPTLQGQALYIEDSAVDRELLRFHVRNQGLTLTTCNSLAEGVELLKKKQFDVILSDGELPELTPKKIVEDLRTAGHAKPIIVVTGEEASEGIKALQGLSRVATLAKPYPIDELMDALALALTGVPVLPPIVSAHWPNEEMRPLITSFVSDMLVKLGEMEAQAKAKAFAVVQRMSLELKGAAGGYGYASIQAAASELHLLSKSQDKAQAINDQVIELIRMAEAARTAVEIDATAV